MNPLTLSEIWIYPVKSLGGIKLETASVRRKGLQYDRRWMLIDQRGVAMTQRVYPEMALFKVRIEKEEVLIDYKQSVQNISSAKFGIASLPSSPPLAAEVWDDHVQVHEVAPAVSEWFSHHLKTHCRLVVFPEKNPRPVDPRYSIPNEHVSLADAYPFLIIGQKSLDDLNSRLQHPVPMNRFRPNFVFTGGKAFMEDTWREVTIGNLRFAAVKKSDRCVLTTVNQDSGVRGVEPLKTLSTYRKLDNKVYFGENMVALDEGKVSVGDRIIPS